MYAVRIINRELEDECLFVFPNEAEACKFEALLADAKQDDGWSETVLYAADSCNTGEQAFAVWQRMQGGST